MKKFHIAIGVFNIEQSIVDYSARLGQQPQIVIDEEYALWRTDILNFSIRKIKENNGIIRHLGWEDSTAEKFSSETDINGIIWENFNEDEQIKEIVSTWPDYQQK